MNESDIEKIWNEHADKFNQWSGLSEDEKECFKFAFMHGLEFSATTERGKEWLAFSAEVLNHIENYTVIQHGDKGDDPLTGYSPEDCRKQVDKYQNRRGKNQREGQDELDILKAAHYLAVAWTKGGGEKQNPV